MKLSYGGVVFDDQGRVLLREPSKHYDGYVWTFAKGEANSGESPEVAALREVLEETGVEARVVTRVPGEFLGRTSKNQYWAMAVGRDTGRFGWETQSVRWVEIAEAKKLIGLTTNAAGRERDLAVLDAAVRAWRER